MIRNGRNRPTTLSLIIVLSVVGVCSSSSDAQSEPSVHNRVDTSRQTQFYQADKVQTVRLRIAETDLERMIEALPKRIFVTAAFQWDDVTIQRVGVRFKGNSSSSPRQQHKRSFLIKFDEFEKGQRFIGLHRASLDNGVQFGSLFSEPIVTEILRDLKIPTHRCNYARLFLNGNYHGVYVNVERIDEAFVSQHLPDASGPLFKVDEGGPGCNLQFIGENPEQYARTFEPKNKAARNSASRVVDLIRVINQTEPSRFAQTLEANLEVDDFLSTTAVMLFAGAFDQLTGWQAHNYYLYRDRKTKRWRYLPWDLDVGFSETAFGRIQVLADWNAAWPLPTTGGSNPLLERIIADPVLLARYRESALRILKQFFEPDRLCAIVDAKYRLIKNDLRRDPFPHRRVTNPDDRSYDDIVSSIKDFVRKRYATALGQLENPGERPKHVGRQQRGPGESGIPPDIADKLHMLQQRMGDLQRRQQSIHKLMRRLPGLIQQGKTAEAERLLDRAIKLLPK